jgi:hypothetical protein
VGDKDFDAQVFVTESRRWGRAGSRRRPILIEFH